MEVFAHRCRGFGLPENGIRSIRAALQSNVAGIEFDIRLTKDRKWVTTHDPYYEDEEQQVRRIHERTLSQIKREVIDLDTVLALHAALAPKKQLMIDVKDVGETRQLVQLVKRHDTHDNIVVIAWEPEILKRVHKEDPTIKIGLSYVPILESMKNVSVAVNKPLSRQGVLLRFNKLHSFDTKFRIGKTHQHYLSELPDLPLYCIQVFALFCSRKLVERSHEKGLKVYGFVVNNSLTVKLLSRRNVDGFLTDTPRSFT